MVNLPDHSSVKLSIDSRLENVYLIGLAIRHYGLYLDLGETEAYNLELCVVEAVNNAIKHGCHGQAGYTVDVAMTIEPEWIVVKVSNCCSSPFHLPEGDAGSLGVDLEAPAESGRGLGLIHLVMDDVTIESVDGINMLTMKKRRIKTR